MPANGTFFSGMARCAALYFRRQTSRPQASKNRLAALFEEFSKQFGTFVGEYAALDFETMIEGRAVT